MSPSPHPEFQAAYPTRSTVERIVACTATNRGRRITLRYLGVDKNHAWLRLRCAAINLRTLINSGLTRTDGRGPWPDRQATLTHLDARRAHRNRQENDHAVDPRRSDSLPTKRPRRRSSPCHASFVQSPPSATRDRIFDHWKPHPKDRSAIGGFGGNRAVMGLDDRTHDGQAQPDA